MSLSETEKKLLTEVQRGIPLVARPWRAVGRGLGIGERKVASLMREFFSDDLIREVGPIFDSAGLGYQSTLVAARVPAKKVPRAAAPINMHPGVSHNYIRSGALNLWFTLTLPPTSDLERTVERLTDLAGLERVVCLPAIGRYKTSVQFDLSSETQPSERDTVLNRSVQKSVLREISTFEAECVRALQEGPWLVTRPFAAMARRLGSNEAELVRQARSFRTDGVLRRVAAVLRHQRIGYRANALAVWNVPEESCGTVGPIMASFRGISHCYHRPRQPSWPYTLYTMMHGHSKAECTRIARAVSVETGVAKPKLLFSLQELKKNRVRYFSPDTKEWEDTHLGTEGGSE